MGGETELFTGNIHLVACLQLIKETADSPTATSSSPCRDVLPSITPLPKGSRNRMTSERFHKAARNSALDILKEATKKDCNARDEGGVTPTLWAAFEGHIDALRLLVARGGDPDKTDYFGNTALHLAAARGHEYCVKFLVNFGCNIWSLDIDRHSARDLAAINGREMTLQFLDFAQADQELNNRKKSRILREKAEKDAEKRLKEYMKKQKMAEIRAEKEQKKLSKDRTKLDLATVNETGILPQKPSMLTFKGRVKPSLTFSDIVGTTTKKHGSAVCKKALAKKAVDDFKVVEIEVNGKKSIRSLTGLRRDSEVMYVGTYETQAQQIGKRGRISDVWSTLSKAQSTPDLLSDRIFDENMEQNDREDTNDMRDNTFLQEPAKEETDEEWTPLQRFLVANNLSSIHPILESEQIDLEALMLLTETDIAALKLPLGPKRKLMNAIANRKRALDAPENVIKDSRL
ncbi:Usher syndrome type-1G protein like protein [Habropoda laboriosa]|uniref:Usher syndrome type-1G protein like protein n=1 Tax=Habropoda laboriosa TaxID=597456 RepID=A0A0L7QR70_9HYME|nr:Usher syndrome type-1G protein like protein [Habropoda laboriosa]